MVVLKFKQRGNLLTSFCQYALQNQSSFQSRHILFALAFDCLCSLKNDH